MEVPQGILIRVEMIDCDGESYGVQEIVVTLDEETIDVRLNNDEKTIAILDLNEIEESIRTLKRWRKEG